MRHNELLERYFAVVEQEDLYSSPDNLRFYLDYLFEGVRFPGKAMLDIGGGSGLFSFYAGCMGAKTVVCLEPEAEGAGQGVINKFQKFSRYLSLDQVKLVPITLQKFDPASQKFDIILLHNSINHLDESACMSLEHDSQALSTYKALLHKISSMASRGAKIIVADCSRYNFFALLHLKNPIAPAIEWHKHQPPELWARLLSDCGFVNPKIRWTSLNRLRSAGRLFLGNRVVSFFLRSHFVLTMEKDW